MKSKESFEVLYLGSENIQISKMEKELCNFYNVKITADDGDMIKFNINNRDYFILNTYSKNFTINRIQVFKKDEEIIIVTFNKELIINDKCLKNKYKKVAEDIKEEFLYSLALYYIRNEDIESCEAAIAQTGDINAYKLLKDCKSINDKEEFVDEAILYIKEKDKRFKSGKVKIKIKDIEEDTSCLIEVLEEIMKDEESKLLYDYSYMYSRIGTKSNMIEDDYSFIRPQVGYGEIIDIVIGSQKLNLAAKVRVSGEVINKEDNLKLDAYILREYVIILNGCLNMDFIWCTLSKKLKSKYRKDKIIKSIDKIYGKEIITLDLRKLKITNNRVTKSLKIDEIAEYLYKIEKYKVKQRVVSTLMKELQGKLEDISSNGIYERRLEIMKRYRVNTNGLYSPLSTEKNENDFSIYLAEILEWKVEKFPKKNVESEVVKEYSKLIDDDIENSYIRLKNLLKAIKTEKKELEYNVNRVRLSAGITGKQIFIWEAEHEKEKKETDKILNINSVIGAKVKISTKTINNITIREDNYKALIRYEDI